MRLSKDAHADEKHDEAEPEKYGGRDSPGATLPTAGGRLDSRCSHPPVSNASAGTAGRE